MKCTILDLTQAIKGGAKLAGIGLAFLPAVGFASPTTSRPQLAQEEVDKIYRAAAEKTRSEQQRIARTLKQSNAGPISQADLESLVIAQNKTYPKTSREGMRVDRSTAGPGLLTYHKTVVGRTADEFDINPANFAAYRTAFIKDACANAGVVNLLDSGITVKNIVRDMHGKLIYEFSVRPTECAR